MIRRFSGLPEPLGCDLPLVKELVPAPLPVDAFRQLRDLDGALFLDSAFRHPVLGRYSFIAADPFERVRVALDDVATANPPLDSLRELLGQFRAETVPDLPPFQGGAAGLFSYDLARSVERVPAPSRDAFGFPQMVLGIYDWTLAFDHLERRAWIISQGFPEREPDRRRERARERLAEVCRWLDEPRSTRGAADAAEPPPARRELPESFPLATFPRLRSNFDRGRYLDAIGRAIDYVYAGDVFQVNLAQKLYYPQETSVHETYRRLRDRNPATFAAFFHPPGESFFVLSASPERFLRLDEDGWVETRPIKGTRPRGRAEEDCFSRDELRESQKDRSENVMIVDLLRNDLSRVCESGSVQVPALFGVETYPSIHHLVSVVRGCLRAQSDATDLLAASFPGGSITGAPKIRAMEIIAELEPDARGPYCGSLGYVGFDGAMDTSILIRTITIADGWLQFPVGGGIVADSSPEAEYQETLDKARGILWAL